MLLSEEEQENVTSFYSPLCKSIPYLTPEQRRKLREKRKLDVSPVSATNDESVKSNKKVRRLFPQKPKQKVLNKKTKPKKVNKVSLPEVCCTAAEWVPQNKTNSENKKFFKTRSPEHLKKAKFVLQYKKSRIDFSEGKHYQDISYKSALTPPPEINTNEPNRLAQSATSVMAEHVFTSMKMTENPHIVKLSCILNENALITEGECISNSVLESDSKCVLSNENVSDKGVEFTNEAQETEIPIVSDLVPSCSSANTTQENKITSKPNYPIFYKENIKKMKWDTSPPPLEKFLNEPFRTKDKSKGCEQMIIDAGQKKIGAILCKTCGMIYTIGHEEDEKLHSENHHIYLQLKFPGWKDERVIGNYEDGRIIKILKDDKNFKLKKIQDILLIVNRELGFPSAEFNGYLQGQDTVIVLFVSNDKYVKGCLVAESISSASPVVLDKKGSSNSYYASSEAVRAICGINRIWVAREHRKQKIASRMVDCLRSNFILGLVVSVEELAFTDPTEDGMQFAASYTGTDNFLVYK